MPINLSFNRATKLMRGCVVMMKPSSLCLGYGNAQCISSVCEELNTVSLFGHNKNYKTWDVLRVVEYPIIETETDIIPCPRCGSDWDISHYSSCECGASIRKDKP